MKKHIHVSRFDRKISDQEFCTHTEDFYPFIIHGHVIEPEQELASVLRAARSRSDIVDVSYIKSGLVEYNGILSERKVVNIPLDYFIGLYDAAVASHDVCAAAPSSSGAECSNYSQAMLMYYSHLLEGKQLYLSQMPLPLPSTGIALGADLQIPSCLTGCDCHSDSSLGSIGGFRRSHPNTNLERVVDIHQSNLWINLQGGVSSSLHYDGYHNLLSVLRGQKEVILVSPQYTAFLQPYPAYSSAANHSHLTAKELRELTLNSDSSSSSISSRSANPVSGYNADTGTNVLPADFLEQVSTRITVAPGDVLFIPEGWWHHVTSDKCTVAVNYWFHSPLHKLLHGFGAQQNCIAHYIMRVAVQVAVDAVPHVSCQVTSTNNSEGKKWEGYHGRCQTATNTIKQTDTCAYADTEVSAESTDELAGGSDGSFSLANLTQEFECDMHALYTLLLAHNRFSMPDSTVKDAATSTGIVQNHCDENECFSIAKDIQALQWLLFCSPYYAVAERMALLLPFYANKHTARWITILCSLSPAIVHTLVSQWEAHDAVDESSAGVETVLDENFFQSIYLPCGRWARLVRLCAFSIIVVFHSEFYCHLLKLHWCCSIFSCRYRISLRSS